MILKKWIVSETRQFQQSVIPAKSEMTSGPPACVATADLSTSGFQLFFFVMQLPRFLGRRAAAVAPPCHRTML